MPRQLTNIAWASIAVVGAIALGVVALSRGEPINAVWLVAAAVCTYLIAFRYYSSFYRQPRLEARRQPPYAGRSPQ